MSTQVRMQLADHHQGFREHLTSSSCMRFHCPDMQENVLPHKDELLNRVQDLNQVR